MRARRGGRAAAATRPRGQAARAAGRLAGVLFLFAVRGAGPAAAQEPGDLAAAEIAADAGDVERARSFLARWAARTAGPATGPEAGRFLLLRARLTADPDSAEVDYVEAAIRGDARYGALARLRLAQLRLARGRPGLAAEDLARLRSDFPGSDRVGESWHWTGQALQAAGDPEGACEAWERARQAGHEDAGLAAALAACAAGTGPGAFTVQLGAFGSGDAAERVRSSQALRGLDPRIDPPDATTPLHRVRVGRFARKDDAARLAVRLRGAGLEAIVVPVSP
ncbi:MAG: SPOR domain-containing protein [Gemmatimonadota bacterium]|nr:SPOR domain-containing protein [Gemmatimonadota bacterium]